MAQPFFKASTAFYLIDDSTLCGTKDSPVKSGWDFDSRECKYISSEKSNLLALATDNQSRYDVFIKRKILPQNDGTLGFHFSFTLEKSDGFFLSFSDEKSLVPTLEISVCDGTYVVNGKNTGVQAKNKTVIIDGVLYLDRNKACLYTDNSSPVEVLLTCSKIDTVKIGAKAHTQTVIFPHRFHLWKNYFICDRYSPNLSRNWKICKSTNADVTCNGEYRISCSEDGKATLCRKFDCTSKTAELEMKYLFTKGSGTCRISLKEKDCDAFCVTDDGQSLCFEGKTIKKHLPKVWQTLRVIADFCEKKAVIYLNGKKAGEYVISGDCALLDGMGVEFSSTCGGVFSFCDIALSPAENLPEDYVPEPIMPKKKDYIVGINTCSLWRNGYHRGWDVITPFDENKTYLGYYDEGTAEVSDTEIKWMAESGIDFQFFCWFNSRTRLPIKKTAHSAALHDGYFKAKYSENIKFAIIWEAASGGPTSIEDFQSNIVPYWLEYFLSDKRYMTFDNKAVIAVYGISALIRDFGSVAQVRHQFDYLDEKAKSIGLDGIVLLCCGQPSQDIKACGFEGVFAYNWTDMGFNREFTYNMISRQRKNSFSLHIVPTASTGFNCVAWHSARYPQMKPDDMAVLFDSFKSDFLLEKGGCLDRLVMLSTWNEYGEGTYMCPSELYGFGYLDQIRKAFTHESTLQSHAKPDENRLSRICRLYPRDRGILKPLRKLGTKDMGKAVSNLNGFTKEWTSENGLSLCVKDGVIQGASTDFDPHMFLTGLNIPADRIKGIGITVKGGMPKGSDDYVTLYFKTSMCTEFSESRSLKHRISPSKKQMCMFDFSNLSAWNGTVTELRLDPLSSEGSFEIYSIELFEDIACPSITFNGIEFSPPVPVCQKNGKIYIPFESGKDYGNLKIYSQWNKTAKELLIVYENISTLFTVGESFCTVNGTKRPLDEPLSLCDGLPMLDLNFLCEIFGLSLSVDEKRIQVHGN